MIREVLGPGGLVASALPGYEARPGQLAMAERIALALERDDRLLVEAGTGTGKTLAYLVPAILSGKKIVISTVQKFPFILDELGSSHREKRFAIVIDEAHSSQGGRATAALNQAFAEGGA